MSIIEKKEEIIKNTHKTSSLHANCKNDSGLDYMIVGVVLRSLFPPLSDSEILSLMKKRISESSAKVRKMVKIVRSGRK